MAEVGGQFDDLMRRVRAGCPEAIGEMFERYGEYIRRVIRRRLDRRLRPQYDSIDFVQSVWASILEVPPDRYTFATADDLVGFLVRVATNKVIDAYRRRLGTIECERGHEEPLGDAAVCDREPTPSQLAMAEERWDQMLDGQSEEDRRILELLRQGCTHQETADRLGVNVRRIHRLLQKLGVPEKS
jgi:RNA polymerase sigma-70 factor (ECF subfamily)